MSAPLAVVAALRVAGGLVTVTQHGDALEWHARWVLAADDAGVEDGVLALAAPLPAGETLAPREGVSAVVEHGRVVALRVDARGREDRTIRANFVQTTRIDGGPLGAPIAAGTAAQIVDVDLGGGARLEIERDRADGRGPPRAACDETLRLTAYHRSRAGAATCLRGVDVAETQGLRGRVTTSAARLRRTFAVVSMLFGALVLALAVAWRRLRRRAAAERADALLASEIEAL